MHNAQIIDALVKALSAVSQNSIKKIAKHKSAALEPKLPFAQFLEKMHQEDITRTHIDRH